MLYNLFQPDHANVILKIETNYSICIANHLSAFCMKVALTL